MQILAEIVTAGKSLFRFRRAGDSLPFQSFDANDGRREFNNTRESSMGGNSPNHQQGMSYTKFDRVDRSDGLQRHKPGLITCLLVALVVAVLVILPLLFFTNSLNQYFTSHLHSHHVRDDFALGHFAPGPHIHPAPQAHDVTHGARSNKRLKLPPPQPPSDYGKQCRVVPDALRLDCYPPGGADRGLAPNRERCEARGCCWLPKNTKNRGSTTSAGTSRTSNAASVPFCFYAQDARPYRTLNVSETAFGLEAFLARTTMSPYPEDVPTLRVVVRFETADRIRIKVLDADNNRFEPPYPETPVIDRSATCRNYTFQLDEINGGFTIIRKSDNTTIFDVMNFRNMIYANQLLQITTRLTSDKIYGLGEHRMGLALPLDWQSLTMLNHDAAPSENANLYGSHPFYLALEPSNRAHGVFLRNSNPMEIALQPGPALTYRAIGGILDFYVVLGPSPADVIRQYTELVGLPYLPPYWALGFHLCRFGYKTLNDTREVMQRNLDAGIPIDTQWNDLDYMNSSNDFTYDHENYKGLPAFVRELHRNNMHYIPLVDAGISAGEKAGEYAPYDIGVDMDIFVKNSTGQLFIGKVWNTLSTVWPDFTNPNVVEYWKQMLESLHDEVAFDGAWIDMNEPANFLSGSVDGCPLSQWDSPPYLPSVAGGELCHKTMCMSAQQYAGRHYDVHNLYGMAEAIVTSFVLAEIRGKRPMVISRATFAGHGHYAGHWSGDVYSKWADMKYSVPQMLSYSMFGIPLMGADICGFNGNTTEALCNRWHQLGAFYPFSRNHNTDNGIDQDPAAFGEEVIASARKSLTVRYTLLPYLYTLFWRAHIFGDTVARPLFFEFADDNNTHLVDEQFLWGSAIMILPVLTEGATTVQPYLPPDCLWYDYYTLAMLPAANTRPVLPAPLDTIPVLLRGGHVVPTQKASKTTAASRQRAIELIAIPDATGAGWGELYWDDGDSLNTYEERKFSRIEFQLGEGLLAANPTDWCSEHPPNLGAIIVLGVMTPVVQVTIRETFVAFEYDTVKKTLLIPHLDIDLQDPFSVTWK